MVNARALCERHFARFRRVLRNMFSQFDRRVSHVRLMSISVYICSLCSNMYVYIEICMRMAAMHFLVVFLDRFDSL